MSPGDKPVPKAGFDRRRAFIFLGAGLLLIVPLLIVLAGGFTLDPHQMPSPLLGKEAPAFDLKRYDTDQAISLESLRGKPVVLNFWATWCVSCRYEHPLLVQAEKRYGDKIQFVGIAYQDKREEIERWLKRHGGSTYPTVVDIGGKTSIAYGIYAVPETFFIDADGIVQHKQVGALDGRGLRKQLDALVR